MRVVATELPEVLIVHPDVHYDGRGFFVETYHAEKHRTLGIAQLFIQDNQSRSVRNTLRGLHLQVARPQAKLIRVIEVCRKTMPKLRHCVAGGDRFGL